MTSPAPSSSTSATVQRFPELKGLMDGNRAWASRTCEEMPELLPKLATGQTPKILWIGCVDSRVPETLITSCRPGDIFVHRNIANQFQRDDPSANAVLEYALGVVGCTHVIVVGHTGCGGAIASFAQPKPSESAEASKPDTHLMQFLDPLIRFRHSLPEGSDVNDLIRENVKDGVRNLVDSPAVKTAWGAGKEIWLHGWMFDIEHGLLHDLECSVGPETE